MQETISVAEDLPLSHLRLNSHGPHINAGSTTERLATRRRVVIFAVAGGFTGALVMGAIAYMMPIPNTGGAPFFVAAALLMGMGSMAYVAGWALHILTGLIIGMLFGIISSSIKKLEVKSIGKGLALGAAAGIIVWLVFFMPMMVTLMPTLMGMTSMIVGSFVAHIIFGIIMGSITYLAVRNVHAQHG